MQRGLRQPRRERHTALNDWDWPALAAGHAVVCFGGGLFPDYESVFRFAPARRRCCRLAAVQGQGQVKIGLAEESQAVGQRLFGLF